MSTGKKLGSPDEEFKKQKLEILGGKKTKPYTQKC